MARNKQLRRHIKKKAKGLKCQMKYPNRKCPTSCVHYNDEFMNWYTWRGINHPRQIWAIEMKRAYSEVFVNTHNSLTSSLFDCNTSVITGVSGRSIMYKTGYVAKGTMEEGLAMFGEAASHMVKSMKTKVEGQNRCQKAVSSTNTISKHQFARVGVFWGDVPSYCGRKFPHLHSRQEPTTS